MYHDRAEVLFLQRLFQRWNVERRISKSTVVQKKKGRIMNPETPNGIDNLEIEPLSDEALDLVAAGQEPQCTTTGPACCSCSGCSNQTLGTS